MTSKLVIVLVLYQKQLQDCPSYRTISAVISKRDNTFLLVYDNSEQSQEDRLFDNEQVRYVHDGKNPGLAKAYNIGAEWLKEMSGEFLMLLDQDTKIDVETMNQMMDQLGIEDPQIGAFVPCIYSGTQRISPVFSDQYISRTRRFPETGRIDQPLMAINSGTILTKSGLAAIGNFNEIFPLDFLDHWVFWELYQQKKSVSVLPVTLEHDLSVLDYSKVSMQRYESILTAETRFYTTYDTSKRLSHIQHLRKRIIKQFLTVKNRKIWRRTMKEYRLLARDKK